MTTIFGRKTGHTELALLGAIVLIAFLLRVWGTGAGLPHVYNVDEGLEVYRALRLGMGGLELDRWTKGGYYFLLFVEYGVYFILLYLTGVVSGVWDFATLFVTEPSSFWMIGRVTTATLGAGAVLLVWWQARRMAGPWSGLLAAWFLSLSLLHVKSSHFITVDVPMAFFAFWALFLIAEDSEGRRPLQSYLFAPVAAFAIACKFPAVVLFLSYFVGKLMRGGLLGANGLLGKRSVLTVIATAVIYLALSPGILWDFLPFLQTWTGQIPVGPGQGAGRQQGTSLWAYYSSVLFDTQGIPLMVAAAIGAAGALVRSRRAATVHLIFIVALFVGISATQASELYYPRYLVPLLPGLCLFAGIGITVVLRSLRMPASATGLVGLAAALLLVIEPGMASVNYVRELLRPDTRTRTVEWVEANIPDGARILLEGSPEEDSQLSVPLRNSRANIEKMITELKSRDPGKALYWELRLKAHSGPAYDLVTVRHFEPWGTLSDYKAQGVRYVILRRNKFVSSDGAQPQTQSQSNNSRQTFYSDLRQDPEAELLKSFTADSNELRGPPIELWSLEP